MIYNRRFFALLFSIATFLQRSPTIAVNQVCVDAILAYPTTASLDYSELQPLISAECEGKKTCTVDLSTWSTNGLSDQDFADQCGAAGRVTADDSSDDVVINCPSLAATFTNLKLCFPAECFNAFNKRDTEVEMLKKGGVEYCSDINGKLSVGAIVGIVVGLVLACGGCAFYCVRRAKSKDVPTE
jgi:hypothetical protein